MNDNKTELETINSNKNRVGNLWITIKQSWKLMNNNKTELEIYE